MEQWGNKCGLYYWSSGAPLWRTVKQPIALTCISTYPTWTRCIRYWMGCTFGFLADWCDHGSDSNLTSGSYTHHHSTHCNWYCIAVMHCLRDLHTSEWMLLKKWLCWQSCAKNATLEHKVHWWGCGELYLNVEGRDWSSLLLSVPLHTGRCSNPLCPPWSHAYQRLAEISTTSAQCYAMNGYWWSMAWWSLQDNFSWYAC